MWGRCDRERDWIPPLGDSSRAAGRRLERFVSQVDVRHPDGRVVAVTHGGVLADFLRNVIPRESLEAAHAAFARAPYDGNVVRECSVTRIRLVRGSIELVELASVAHL